MIAPLVGAADLLVLLLAMELGRRIFASYSGVFEYLGLAFVAGLTFLLCSRFWHLHRYSRLLAPRTAALHITLAVLLGVGVVALLLFLLKEDRLYSRGAFITFFVLALCFLFAERLAVSRLLKSAIAADIIRGRRVMIIGENSELEHLSTDQIFSFGVREVGRIGLSLSNDADGLSDHDRHAVQQAINMARGGKASEYALIIPWSFERTILEASEMLRASPRAVRLYPDRRTRARLSRKGSANLDSSFYAEVQPEPLTFADRCAKRMFDIVIASCAVVMLAPIMIAAAAFVKLTSAGPVFFRQTRKGFDDHEFKILKFRTMKVMEDGATVTQAQRNDRRVTRIGRILRRTSVDELPQLLNILTGEMSVVGPRPHAVAHDKEYDDSISQYALRRHVKPGLTGLAQIHGLRGETQTVAQMEKRIEKDLWYIDNWSLWLDLKIASQTLIALVVNEAY